MDSILNRPWVLAFLLAAVLAAVLEIGRSIGGYFKVTENANLNEQMKAIRDGLFVLLSLLLGFTLTLAAARFADRRSLLIEEAVSLGTTWLRTSTLPAAYRDHSQQLLREYAATRLDLDQLGKDTGAFAKASNRARKLQEGLWSDAVAVTQNDRSAIAAVYLNALNETIDLDEKRVAAFENRIPPSIWLLLTLVSIIALFTRGATVGSRFWLTLIIVPLTVAIVVGLIADLDAPSGGLLRLDEKPLLRLQADLSADLH